MLHIVIPAGGSGTRLWPLSRANYPKFLHALDGTPATLLQATVNRLAPVTSDDMTYIVTGTAHAPAVARQIPQVPDENILVEPFGRDSCGAIGLAAALIARKDPAALMGAFSADHIVRDERRFVECVRAAVAGAEEGLLVVFGIDPTHAETGYGYVECDEAVGQGPIRRVTTFKEKPTADVAEEYVRSGRYYWNASMFVWRVDVFLGELKRQQPQMHDALLEIAAAWDGPRQQEVLGEVWPTLPRISVDFAVMEGAAKAGIVGAVPSDFGWTDVGHFHTLGEALAEGPDANVVIRAAGAGESGGGDITPVLLEESDRLVVLPHSGRLVAALGVHDLVIVDTPDVLMVCDRAKAQDVRRLVARLQEDGGSRYL
ncbi:mannose-1-phosphate guanylyltransferase [Phytohabitans suffuscus]|uniref:Mannose-1-phosphate guanyltransferase n=1 Tax=Phytohabitans suffuscus TaxID=624315 RepID=A0A6F8YGA4_9ACTN|nr:mannose-1-phosphate guanylyltransferase [Phytohabitans suffuscus]BCB85097.1 mannose-1-phosphate guanyltransferase [Phytohabitans suffuscus]